MSAFSYAKSITDIVQLYDKSEDNFGYSFQSKIGVANKKQTALQRAKCICKAAQ